MNNSHVLKEQLAAARAQLAAAQENSKNDELGDFFVSPWEAHAEDLTKELHFAESAERGEVLEFRLFGEKVNNGTIPLRTVAKIAGPLNDWLASAAHWIRYGADIHRGVGNDVARDLDIRLSNLGLGSTRIFLTGDSRITLSEGESLFTGTMTHLFKLLNSDFEHFYDDLHSVGMKSARKLDDLMSALESDGLAVKFSWAVPGRQDYVWEGRVDEIVRIRALLSGAEDVVTEQTVLSGQIALLSETGRIEIHSKELGKKVKVSYSRSQYPAVLQLHLGSTTRLAVQVTRYYSPAAQKTIEKYSLLSE